MASPPARPASPASGGASSSTGLARRPRAPTITIDTSAVRKNSDSSSHVDHRNDHEAGHLSDPARSGNGDRSPGLRPTANPRSTPTELRVSNSFESNASRPTSSHNVSSPTQANNPHGFLAVPSRSRGQSLDTNASIESSSSNSDLTYVNTHTPSTESPGKNFPDHGRNRSQSEPMVLPADQALKPDPNTEDDFHRDNNPFAFTPGHLGKLYNPKSLGAFYAMGGLGGLEKGLWTDRNAGLSVDEQGIDGKISFQEAADTSSPSSDTTAVEEPEMVPQSSGEKHAAGTYADRRRIFNDNQLPERKPKNLLQLMWMAYNDKVLILLSICAVVALGVGLYEDIGLPGVDPGWIEGVAIIIAILIVVLVGSINDWQKERLFAKLNKKQKDRSVRVIRSGGTREISIHDLLVGDVLLVEPGDVIAADGIFITGHSVKCDESSATGESDVMRKTPADHVHRALENQESLSKLDPFMLSGAKVAEGYGRMLVTATGINSTHGKTLMSLQEENDMTPLQAKLNQLAEYIAKIGSAAAILLFIILLIKFLAQLPRNHNPPAQKAQEFLTFLITAVTIVVVAVPEGLPLAVTLALAYATTRMLKDRNLVRVMRSCETMGNATSICSDKTGTLTQNVMTVVTGAVGTSSRFANRPGSSAANGAAKDGHNDFDGVGIAEFLGPLAHDAKGLWKDSIVINSTAFENNDKDTSTFVGSKTEVALLDFAREHLGMDRVAVERSNARIVQMFPFDSGRKCMAMAIRMKGKEKDVYRLLVKGASEYMLRQCTKIISDPTKGIETTPMTEDLRAALQAIIDSYADHSLRTIGFTWRDFESWPPRGAKRQEDDKTQAVWEDVCQDMTFLAVVGLQDPLRAGVPEAVQDCIKAGVFPRMVTGDNLLTAKAIARECGIFTAGGIAIEGPEFRKLSKVEQRALIPKLQVIARSSPEDKRVLVRRLKEMGETVAVTGDGTNDAPALKAADVGFSMNIAGTEVAREASDIILMDDNFASIVNALMWGRAVNDAVKKFLQFQITVNITAVLLAFISAIANSEEQSVLTAVQLLWVNLIMDTMAALALATDPPTRSILDRKPDPKSAPLITVRMWKMIVGQAVYQLVVTLILYFAGAAILNYETKIEQQQLQTLVFNTFVWMQIFNSLNNRRLDNRFNIFEGIFNNWLFCFIFVAMIAGQTIIVCFAGWEVFQAEPQTGVQWGIALVLGALSIPIGVVIRLIPDELALRVVPRRVREWSGSRSKNKVVVTDEESPFDFNQALYDIREELSFIKKYKGGRLNALKFTLQHPKNALIAMSRSPSRSRTSSSLPHTPNNELADQDERERGSTPPPATPDSRSRRRGRSRSNSAFAGAAMAGIIAGSVAGAWSPADRALGDRDSLRFARDRSKSDLSREVKLETHPGTNKTDELGVKGDPVDAADGKPPSQSTKTTPSFAAGPFVGEPESVGKDKGEDVAP